MIGRRAFIAALGLAPAIGKARLQEAGMGIQQGMLGSGAVRDVVMNEESDPIFDAAQRYLSRKADRIAGRLHGNLEHITPAITGMKSWSPVFKMHCHEKDRDKIERLRRLYDLNREELIAMAIKHGWNA